MLHDWGSTAQVSEESAASNAALIDGSLIIASHTTSIKARFFFESEGFLIETLEDRHNPSDCWG